MTKMRRRFPLLLRSGKLLPRESLSSFLVRLAQLNYYEPVTIMSRLCLESIEQDRLDWPSRGETYDRLFDLTWIDPYALHDATGHCFARVLTPPDVEISYLKTPGGTKLSVLPKKIVRKLLRPAVAAQFCPTCLRKALYHRVSWMPVAVAVCTTHKQRLVDQCPNCQAKVPIRAIVEDGHCRRCGADLTKVQSSRIVSDPLGLDSQRFIQWWLGIGRKPVDPARYGLLPQFDPRRLLYLVEGLVDSIRLLGSDWHYMHQPDTKLPMKPFDRVTGKPTPDQSYRLYATAFKALVDWPHGFYEFLRSYASRDSRSARTGVLEDMGRLYSRWLDDGWKSPAFSFIHSAFTRHLVNTYVTSSSTPRQPSCRGVSGLPQPATFVSPVRAARLLEVSVSTIKRLADAGFLVKYTVEHGEPHRYGFVRRDEVLTLRLAWKKGISLGEAARWLGLTQTVVVDLVRVGLLTAEGDPNMDRSSQWMFGKQCLDRCYCRVTTKVRNPGREFSSLPEAARALSVRGLRVADILKLVADGDLGCWSLTQSPALAKLTFAFSDISTLLTRPGQSVRLLDGEETARRLGVQSWVISRWIANDWLSPKIRYGYETYFAFEEIDRFLANHMSSQEAAEMLGLEVKEIEQWPWIWGLEVAKGLGVDRQNVCFFSRENVEQVRAELLASS